MHTLLSILPSIPWYLHFQLIAEVFPFPFSVILYCNRGLFFRLLTFLYRARATSAAPPYFKPFIARESRREFIDGAAYHNNPINVADAERKYIWPDVDKLEPDILLSLGTGKNSKHLSREAEKLQKQEDDSKWTKMLPNALKILSARLSDALDSERAWDRFSVNVVGRDPSHRYIRLNPEFDSAPPALDQKERLATLEFDLKPILASMHVSIRHVADQLIASCFYFEKANVQPRENYIRGMLQQLSLMT